jgi:hypothetical protein
MRSNKYGTAVVRSVVPFVLGLGFTLGACSSSDNPPADGDADADTCLTPAVGGGGAQEVEDQTTGEVVLSGGDDPMPSDEFAVYDPEPPWVVNSSVRTTSFTSTCIQRSPDAPADCTDDCGIYSEMDDYTWLQLAFVVCEDCLPADAGCSATEPPPEGAVTYRVITKCQSMTFEGTNHFVTDAYGNLYILHATPDGAPVNVNPVLPAGWTFETVDLPEPFVLDHSDDGCRYALLRDNFDQGYHQVEVSAAGEAQLNEQLTTCKGQ